MLSKLVLLSIFLGFTNTLFCQRFTLVPEIGVACSQIDGDWLQGFDKRGLTVGVGSNYYISDKAYLGFTTRYMQLGSGRGSSNQSKPTGAIQFTSIYSSAAIGANLMLAPFNPDVRFGFGLNYNRIFDFEFNPLVQLSLKNENFIDEDNLVTNYISYNFNFNFKLIDRLYFNASFHKSINDLIDGEDNSSLIESIVPYYLIYTLVYEIDPNPKRSKRASKKKRRNSKL